MTQKRQRLQEWAQGPVSQLRHDAVANFVANGIAAFNESCAAIAKRLATASDRCSKYSHLLAV